MSQQSRGRVREGHPLSLLLDNHLCDVPYKQKGAKRRVVKGLYAGPAALAPMQRILRLDYQPLRNACLKMAQGLHEQPCLAKSLHNC